MTEDQRKSLCVGDIVKHKLGAHGYQVTGNYGGRTTAVRVVDITNAKEWDLVLRASHSRVETDEKS